MIYLLSVISYVMGMSVQDAVLSSLKQYFHESESLDVQNLYVEGEFNSNMRISHLSPNPPLGAVKIEMTDPLSGKRVNLSANVKVSAPTAKATRTIPAGKTIDENDFAFERTEKSVLGSIGSFHPWSVQALSGKVATRTIRKGEVIKEFGVKPADAIQSGQNIDLTTKKSALTISVGVQALQAGRVGDWILVKNNLNKKILKARIVSSQEVTLQ